LPDQGTVRNQALEGAANLGRGAVQVLATAVGIGCGCHARTHNSEEIATIMGHSLDEILAEAAEGDTVQVVMVSNQDNGIGSYTQGGLEFHAATGGVILGGPPFRPARLESTSSQPLEMFLSDRKLSIDPPPAPNTFGIGPRQPFNANDTEKVGVRISLGLTPHLMQLSLFGSTSLVSLSPMSNLLVGLGPSLSNSAASVFVVAFLGITRPPR